MSRELEILDGLRACSLSPAAEDLVDELEMLLQKDILWPVQVREAAVLAFGGGIHNPNGRVHKSLDRRIRHCLRVWRSRYGLNPAQMIYAGDIMAWAIAKGVREAPNEQLKYPFVLKQLESLVNHERVHEAMEKRSGLIQVDVGEMLHASH